MNKQQTKSPNSVTGKENLVKSIEQQLNVDRIQSKLMSYPEQIYHKQQQLQAAKELVEAQKSELLFDEQIILVEITEAENPATGKPLFSNDTARKAELAKQLNQSKEYQKKLKSLKQLEGAVFTGQFDLDKLNNEFAALQIVARLTASRLALMAALG